MKMCKGIQRKQRKENQTQERRKNASISKDESIHSYRQGSDRCNLHPRFNLTALRNAQVFKSNIPQQISVSATAPLYR